MYIINLKKPSNTYNFYMHIMMLKFMKIEKNILIRKKNLVFNNMQQQILNHMTNG